MKRKKIDTRIKIAISNLRQTCATNEEAGARLGITGKHVGQILKGEVDSIRQNTWEKMEPVLRPLLARSGKEIDLHLKSDQYADLQKLAEANNTSVENYIRTLVAEDIERAQKYKNLD